jgi:hypothetical protein
MVARRLVEARREVYSVFSVEIAHVRAFMTKYPFLTLGLLFFLGLIVDGALRATVSQFVIISLLRESCQYGRYETVHAYVPFFCFYLKDPVNALRDANCPCGCTCSLQ